MHNLQTYTIADLNLFATIVPLTNSEAIKITDNVICSTGICVSVWINLVSKLKLGCGGRGGGGRRTNGGHLKEPWL
jgi:hypothetical protein